MLYTPTGKSPSFCYSQSEAEDSSIAEYDFLRVAASYVSSPYTKPSSPYYDFFGAHDATLWTVDRATRVASPMRLDVVYTYVNPSAPSFQRHLKMRNVPFEQRRYRDWEELRYSLRSLRAFVLDNGALAQYHRRHAADVLRLGELGYRVNESEVAEGEVVPLVRRVYLVLSDVDQVPAWLDAEKFPQLRVVTHRDMFTAEEAAWVLPTMSSNVIESGMHRIPGLSRFFLYFNNDMLVGRKVSFFDLFRPLSPPRQILEMADLVKGTSTVVGAVYQRGRAAERRALFFESIFNSDGYVAPPRRSLLSFVAASLLPAAACERVAELGKEKDWPVSALYSLCAPNQLALPSDNVLNALNRVARYRVQGELPSVTPSMEYAHMPRIVDREIAQVMLEDREDGFGVAVAEMRKAYLRSMNNFSSAHVYESFSLAIRRSRTGALWCQRDARCAASLAGIYPRIARKWRGTRRTFCPHHPLEGVSQEVRLQHADMLQRWAAYESAWLHSAAATNARRNGSTLDDAKVNMSVKSNCTACHMNSTIGTLRHSYTPSPPVKALFSEATARSPAMVSVALLTGCHTQDVVDPSRVQSLVLDVHHHVSSSDKTFRFFIIDNLQGLAITLSKVNQMVSTNAAAAEHARNASSPHPGFHSSNLPLFITVNDDLDGDVLDRQMRSSTLVGWNESLLTETLFRRLLWLSSYMAPKAPWESGAASTPNEA
ncbi:Stealth protein CR2 conserved region 2/Stealth protein CR3 conserved region 3 [Lotmaria passim]